MRGGRVGVGAPGGGPPNDQVGEGPLLWAIGGLLTAASQMGLEWWRTAWGGRACGSGRAWWWATQ